MQQLAVALWTQPVKTARGALEAEKVSAAAGALWHGSRHAGGAGVAAALERVFAQHERLLSPERAGGGASAAGGALLALASMLSAPHQCLHTPR